MKKKTFLFLLIVLVAVGLIGYFISRPVIQAQDAPASGQISGNVYYSGIDCQYGTTDQVDVYKLTAGGLAYITSVDVQLYKGVYFYVVTEDDLESQAGNYQLVPDLYSASGNLGVDPHVRSVSWQPGMIIQNQNFTAIACNHP